MLRKAATLAAATLMLAAASASWAQEPNGQAGADPQTGRTDVERLVNILRTSNKAQVTYYVPKVFDLQYVNPYSVVRFIHRTVQPEEGALYTFAGPDGESGKVIVIAPQHQMPYVEQLIDVIDRPRLTSSDGAARAFVRLKHRSVADEGFLNTVSGNGQFGNFALETDPQLDGLYLKDIPTALADHLKYLETIWDVPTPEVAVDVTIYEIDANNDNAVGLDFHAWKNGPGRNLFALGAFAEYADLEEIDGMLEDIDLGGTPLQNPGVDLMGIPGRKFNNSGENVAYYYEVPSAYFDFLNVKGMARLVTKTKLAILNARQGSISTGEQILYYQTLNGPAPSGGVRPAGQVVDPFGDNINYPDNRVVVGGKTDRVVPGGEITGYVYDRFLGEKVALNRQIAAAESGVFLDVIPTIAEEMITMDLVYTVAQLNGFDGEGIPQLASRTANTTVRARDGEEVIVGGLVREAKIKTTRKVPVLGSLPVIGYWFGGEVSTADRKLVAIVLKPTVVMNFDTLNETPDATLVQQVRQEIPTSMPTDQYGFDQWFLDKPAKDTTVTD